MFSVAPNSPRQTAASVNAPTVPTIIIDGFTNSDQDDSNSNQNDLSEQIIKKISNLQDLESKKYNDLNILLASNPTPDNIAKRKMLMNDITQLMGVRSTLFNTLLQNSKNNMKVNNVMNASLQDKHTIITLKENDLNARRSAIAALEQNVENTQRMVDINVYYKKQYEVRVKIMKYIIILCLLVIFFVVLMNLEWLPKEMVTVLVVIIILVGGSYIGSLIYDAYQRSNINYDEYNWGFDADKMASTIAKQPKDKKKASKDRRTCATNDDDDDSITSKMKSLEDSIKSSSSTFMSELTEAAGGGDSGTTDPSKVSESFMLSKMPRKFFSDIQGQGANPFTIEDNYGKI